MKYVFGHTHFKSPTEYLEEDRGYKTPCWIWQRSTTNYGYGNINLRDGRWSMAHRVVYERHRGPIPAGLCLDHLCRVPACVNPTILNP